MGHPDPGVHIYVSGLPQKGQQRLRIDLMVLLKAALHRNPSRNPLSNLKGRLCRVQEKLSIFSLEGALGVACGMGSNIPWHTIVC